MAETEIHEEAWQRALVAVRGSLSLDMEDAAADYVDAEAKRGPWKALRQYFERWDIAVDDGQDVSSHTAADVHNMFALPAVIFGATLAYAVLTNDRGGAR